ncbi:hypothetical protein TanjilG_08004 [Lupinus angustifolius]|uniref:At1g61320/AtMIF1 LRR domain-containing protein n=1 Tax=Lupinus angustifolius TaxID=3871 RepID=A0A4P1RLR5_LUPAN|nr:PREDICTED: putative FBD-associated F-box protein At1g61330 [Lupinus angustifolius]OIW13662.1 hypothetical protein TanjilG_08004 [Lupinus angustifolius]
MFAHEFHRSTENLIALVDHVFNSHEGSVIQCFQLHMSQIGAEEMIEKWLKICIQKGVQELDFNFFQRGYVLVPELLQIPTLKILKLSNVQFGVQPVTNGWQNLHTVILREMELYEEQLENVMLYGKMIQCLDLGSCREIRRISIFASEHKNFRTLKITTCPNLEKIEIDAPTLQHIHYCGFVVKLEFTQVVPSLSEAKFIFFRSRNYLKIPILENLVNHLHNVRVLTTSAQFQEALSYRFRDGVFQVPQFYFSNIRELHIVMDGANFCNPYDIIVFLKNCPSIEMLFIDLNDYHFECGTYWEMHQKPILEAFNQQFDGLKVIKLIGFKFLESELQLLEILLKRSRILETLIFTTPKNARIKIYEPFIPKYKDLIQSWKASPSAKVGLFENSNDKSGIYPSHEKKWYY